MFERGGSKSLNKRSKIIGDTESLKVFYRRSYSRTCCSSGNCGELRRNGDVIGKGLDLIGLTESGGFDLICFLGSFGGEFFGFLGGFGDEIGYSRGGGGGG